MDDVVFKIMGIYKGYISPEDVYALGFVLSSSFVLATTLWCTLLIVYRIVTVARAGSDIGVGLRTYRHVIEVIVESSALYSVTLIMYLAAYIISDAPVAYFDPLAAVARVRSCSFLSLQLRDHCCILGNRPDTPCWSCRGRTCPPG